MRTDFSISVLTGTEFEGEVIYLLETYVKAIGERNFVKTAGTELDKFQGTDVVCCGIPMDITHNFSGKNHTIKVPNETIDAGYVDIKFGVRTGNDHRMFRHPVVVVGIDEDSKFVTRNIDKICCDINKVVARVMDTAMNIYYEFCDKFNVDPELEVI